MEGPVLGQSCRSDTRSPLCYLFDSGRPLILNRTSATWPREEGGKGMLPRTWQTWGALRADLQDCAFFTRSAEQNP